MKVIGKTYCLKMMFQTEIKGLKAVVEEKALFPALYQLNAKTQVTSLSS